MEAVWFMHVGCCFFITIFIFTVYRLDLYLSCLEKANEETRLQMSSGTSYLSSYYIWDLPFWDLFY